MENHLYLIALILIVGWAIGFFALNVGGLIHILLVVALITIILRVIRGKRIS
ncbi:MAG: lmo0937 family membrane protein [Bacteroidia bacterium]|nr:lmo0937 family membrane protein [Bacteroidia bacterium]